MTDWLSKIKSRADGLKDEIDNNTTGEDFGKHLKSGKYLEKGSVERAWWHSGYMVALNDIIRLIKKEQSPLN